LIVKTDGYLMAKVVCLLQKIVAVVSALTINAIWGITKTNTQGFGAAGIIIEYGNADGESF
jgi:hypothetical protein